MNKAKNFFTIRWILTTILVIAAAVVMVRLGFWQLDRLAQRRAFNARVTAQMTSPAIDLNNDLKLDQLNSMEYRDVVVSGQYDLSQQLLLRNQVWNGMTGYRILTPLKINGSSYSVLIDRGWIPYNQASSLSQYDENGSVLVRGKIRAPQVNPGLGGAVDPTYAPGLKPLDAVNIVNLARIQQQTRDDLLPVYIQQAPDPAWTRLPYRSLADIQLDEGPHLGYAIQWFTFAAILVCGYPFFVRRKLRQQWENESIGKKKVIEEINRSVEEWPHVESDSKETEIRRNHHGERK